MRMSKALYGSSSDNANPLIMPAATASGILSSTQLLSFNENRLKNESKIDAMNEADDESFDEARKCNAIRRNSQLEIPQVENAFDNVQLRRKSIEKTESFSIADESSNGKVKKIILKCRVGILLRYSALHPNVSLTITHNVLSFNQ